MSPGARAARRVAPVLRTSLTLILRPAAREPHSIRSNRHADRGGEIVQWDNIGLKLLEAKVISPDALQKAQLQIRTGGGTVTAALVKLGVITEEALSKFLGELYGVPSADL